MHVFQKTHCSALWFVAVNLHFFKLANQSALWSFTSQRTFFWMRTWLLLTADVLMWLASFSCAEEKLFAGTDEQLSGAKHKRRSIFVDNCLLSCYISEHSREIRYLIQLYFHWQWKALDKSHTWIVGRLKLLSIFQESSFTIGAESGSMACAVSKGTWLHATAWGATFVSVAWNFGVRCRVFGFDPLILRPWGFWVGVDLFVRKGVNAWKGEQSVDAEMCRDMLRLKQTCKQQKVFMQHAQVSVGKITGCQAKASAREKHKACLTCEGMWLRLLHCSTVSSHSFSPCSILCSVAHFCFLCRFTFRVVSVSKDYAPEKMHFKSVHGRMLVEHVPAQKVVRPVSEFPLWNWDLCVFLGNFKNGHSSDKNFFQLFTPKTHKSVVENIESAISHEGILKRRRQQFTGGDPSTPVQLRRSRCCAGWLHWIGFTSPLAQPDQHSWPVQPDQFNQTCWTRPVELDQWNWPAGPNWTWWAEPHQRSHRSTSGTTGIELDQHKRTSAFARHNWTNITRPE